jgi:hypothetical protein
LKLDYGYAGNSAVFTGVLSGVNNNNYYELTGNGQISFVAVQTGDYVVKYIIPESSAHDVIYYNEFSGYYENYGFVATGSYPQITLEKQVSFTGSKTDYVVVPKRFMLSVNLT